MPKTLQKSAKRPRPRAHADSSGSAHGSRWIVPLILLAIVACLWPVLTCDFTSWDDWSNVEKNPLLNPPTLEGMSLFWMKPFIAK
jgi:hypothetical protein